MIERRRASAQLAPIPPSGTPRDKKTRRRSTSEINRRRSVDVEVRPIVDDATILAGRCGRVVSSDDQTQFILTPEHSALERRLIKESAGTIASNRGPEIQSIMSTKPRGRILLDLEAPTLITNHIVVGSKREASDSAILHSLGITHILNTAAQLDNAFPHLFVSHKISLLDDPSTNLLEFVEEAVAFIRHVEEVKGRVFVHCVAGVSRSVSFVLFHLMTTHRIPLKIAYQHVKTARPFIHPNEGFKVQLANYEVSLFGSSSVITNAGKDWDFYEWNRVKRGLKRQKSTAQSIGCLLL